MLWGHSIDFWDKIGFWLMIAGAGFGFFALAVSLGSSFILYRVSSAQNEIIASNAARTEQKLLDERRLTANERWRLERVEKAVLPRSLTARQRELLAQEFKGKGLSINIAFGGSTEATLYGIALMQALNEAGLATKPYTIPKTADLQGVTVYAVIDDGRLIAEALHKAEIAGSLVQGMLPMDLQGVPANENLLVVGANNAASQGGAGQPGESISPDGAINPRPP
jgi:hypothetical protein